MQTYTPIRGMIVCVSGGEYVNRKDAENKIAALEKRVKELESDNYQYLNIIQANDLMGCIPTKEN